MAMRGPAAAEAAAAHGNSDATSARATARFRPPASSFCPSRGLRSESSARAGSGGPQAGSSAHCGPAPTGGCPSPADCRISRPSAQPVCASGPQLPCRHQGNQTRLPQAGAAVPPRREPRRPGYLCGADAGEGSISHVCPATFAKPSAAILRWAVHSGTFAPCVCSSCDAAAHRRVRRRMRRCSAARWARMTRTSSLAAARLAVGSSTTGAWTGVGFFAWSALRHLLSVMATCVEAPASSRPG
jgi:hypothetical protein